MLNSLSRKLGLREGRCGVAIDPPSGLELGAGWTGSVASGQEDAILFFVKSKKQVEQATAEVLARYRRGGLLWIAYPKKSGSIKSDISRDEGWDSLLDAGFLPVAQVALDADWSALRFRYRDEIAKITRKTAQPASAA